MDKCCTGGLTMRFDSFFDKDSLKSFRTSSVMSDSNISVLEIGYNRVPHGLKQIMKRDVYILHYVTSGKGVFLDSVFDENNGYLVVPNELEIVQADNENPYEVYWIMFRGIAATDILKKCDLAKHNSVFQFSKNKQCAEILRKVLFEATPMNELEESYIMQAAFYQIIALHMSEKNELSVDITVPQKVRSFIEINYHQQIKIEDIAKENNYTRNHLYKLFKKEYGISPQEYLLKLRIENAKLLLRDNTKSISVSDVAHAVGFTDCLYFSRLFRKRTGISPTEFKNNTLPTIKG